MADFCKQCSIEIFLEDFKELAGISTAEDTKKEMFAAVLCEDCGYTLVDHNGICVSKSCDKKHGRR